MHRIFISYRRSEAAFAAGALGRELKQHFGEAQVFRDREDIEGGVSWRAQVLSAIDRDSALLVLIDRHWLSTGPGRPSPRLFEPDDPVRLEILDALHDGATIIPLLLDDAQMPEAAALPPELQALAEINALPLRDADWPHDFARVCMTLEHAGFSPLIPQRHVGLRAPRPDTMRPVAVTRPAPSRSRLAARALLYASAAILLAGGSYWLARTGSGPSIPAPVARPLVPAAAPQPSGTGASSSDAGAASAAVGVAAITAGYAGAAGEAEVLRRVRAAAPASSGPAKPPTPKAVRLPADHGMPEPAVHAKEPEVPAPPQNKPKFRFQ